MNNEKLKVKSEGSLLRNPRDLRENKPRNLKLRELCEFLCELCVKIPKTL